MKRSTLAVFLTAALAVSALAGCTSKPAETTAAGTTAESAAGTTAAAASDTTAADSAQAAKTDRKSVV